MRRVFITMFLLIFMCQSQTMAWAAANIKQIYGTNTNNNIRKLPSKALCFFYTKNIEYELKKCKIFYKKYTYSDKISNKKHIVYYLPNNPINLIEIWDNKLRLIGTFLNEEEQKDFEKNADNLINNMLLDGIITLKQKYKFLSTQPFKEEWLQSFSSYLFINVPVEIKKENYNFGWELRSQFCDLQQAKAIEMERFQTADMLGLIKQINDLPLKWDKLPQKIVIHIIPLNLERYFNDKFYGNLQGFMAHGKYDVFIFAGAFLLPETSPIESVIVHEIGHIIRESWWHNDRSLLGRTSSDGDGYINQQGEIFAEDFRLIFGNQKAKQVPHKNKFLEPLTEKDFIFYKNLLKEIIE